MRRLPPYTITWRKPKKNESIWANQRNVSIELVCADPEAAGWVTHELRLALDHLLLVAEDTRRINESVRTRR